MYFWKIVLPSGGFAVSLDVCYAISVSVVDSSWEIKVGFAVFCCNILDTQFQMFLRDDVMN